MNCFIMIVKLQTWVCVLIFTLLCAFGRLFCSLREILKTLQIFCRDMSLTNFVMEQLHMYMYSVFILILCHDLYKYYLCPYKYYLCWKKTKKANSKKERKKYKGKEKKHWNVIHGKFHIFFYPEMDSKVCILILKYNKWQVTRFLSRNRLLICFC